MRIVLEYEAERVEFEVPEERLVGIWRGPDSRPDSEIRGRTLAALEGPQGYPPLRQAVVPGDRVVIPLDPSTPGLAAVLSAVREVLRGAGVEDSSIHVVTTGEPPEGWAESVVAGLLWEVHDPHDRAGLAYLATTPQGRRVYLNRRLTDADVVLPVGPIGFDSALGLRGPWSVVFPALSDAETQRAYRALANDDLGDSWDERETLAESAGVSWLLGSQLQVGVLAGAEGAAEVLAGTEEAVQDEGRRALESAWTFRADDRADLVIVGIGRPGYRASLADLADGLATAGALVRRGGKILALTRVAEPPGPAVGRLVGADDPREASASLRGAEGDADYLAARKLARALARADVYLLSELEEQLVEDLGMVPLSKPSEARRLADVSASCLFVGRAEATRPVVTAEVQR